MTPITPALIKTLAALTGCTVMRGAQWIGMHANCRQKICGEPHNSSGTAPHLGQEHARSGGGEKQRLMNGVEWL